MKMIMKDFRIIELILKLAFVPNEDKDQSACSLIRIFDGRS